MSEEITKHDIKIIDIEQGSDEWHIERFRSIGGTRFHAAVGAKYSAQKKTWTLGDKKVQQTLLLEIISEHRSELEIDDYCSPAMQRGHDLEPKSVYLAEKVLNVKLDQCGMLQSTINPILKYSPDAVCFEKGIIVGGYETKSKAGKKHIEYIIDGIVPPEHLLQCLAPMIMSDDIQWWAFGHYDDRDHIQPLFITTIKREDYLPFIADARHLLSGFIAEIKSEVERLGGAYNG